MNVLSDQPQPQPQQSNSRLDKFSKGHRRTNSSPNSYSHDINNSISAKGSLCDGTEVMNPLPSISFNRTPSTVSSNSARSISITQSPRLNQHLVSSSLIGGLTENAIDSMEKEQEGVVMKLMKEIKALQEENKILKQQLHASQSSPLLSTSNCTSPRPSISSSHSIYGNNTSTLIPKRRSTVSDASIRRVPTSVNHYTKSRSGSFSLNNALSPTSSLGILVPPFGGLSVTSGCSDDNNGNEWNGNSNSNYFLLDVNNNDVQSRYHKRRSSVYSTTSTSSSRRGHHLFGNYMIRKNEKDGLHSHCQGIQDDSSIEQNIDDADDIDESYIVDSKDFHKGIL